MIDTSTDTQPARYDLAQRLLLRTKVAQLRIGSVSDRDTLVHAVRDVVANLVGSEEMALVHVAPGSAEPTVVDVVGVDRATLERVLGWADLSAESSFYPEGELNARVVLLHQDTVVGALLIFGLLAHKSELDADDRHLLQRLAPILAEQLHRTANRKGTP